MVNNAYANCLSPDAAASGMNFVSEEAWFRYKIRRGQGWGVEPERCTSNLLSSQALTLNLFGTLAADPGWHAQVLNKVLGWGPGDVVDTRIEYAPQCPSQHLGDKTRIDTLVDWRSDTHRRLIAVEVKYADRYVSRVIDICNSQYYQKLWSQCQRWKYISNAPRINQFYRIHGLAESIALVEDFERGAHSPHFLLIHHDSDPIAQQVFQEYRATLNKDYQPSVTLLPLSRFVDAMAETAQNAAQAAACAQLNLRYLALHRSDYAWSSFKKRGSLF